MLVLSRRPHEGIRIRHDIVVTVLEVSGDKVRLGIEAPANVQIHREEIYLEVQRANEEASAGGSTDAAGLARALGRRGRPAPAGAPDASAGTDQAPGEAAPPA